MTIHCSLYITYREYITLHYIVVTLLSIVPVNMGVLSEVGVVGVSSWVTVLFRGLVLLVGVRATPRDFSLDSEIFTEIYKVIFSEID